MTDFGFLRVLFCVFFALKASGQTEYSWWVGVGLMAADVYCFWLAEKFRKKGE